MLLRMLPLIAVGCLFFSADARADDLSDAKAFISRQVDQIRKGDVAGLKAGFTDRLKNRITAAMVAQARKEGERQRYTLADLVDSVHSRGGSLRIKMKNGRELTTLVKVKGAWKADTIWFR